MCCICTYLHRDCQPELAWLAGYITTYFRYFACLQIIISLSVLTVLYIGKLSWSTPTRYHSAKPQYSLLIIDWYLMFYVHVSDCWRGISMRSCCNIWPESTISWQACCPVSCCWCPFAWSSFFWRLVMHYLFASSFRAYLAIRFIPTLCAYSIFVCTELFSSDNFLIIV